MNRRNFLYSMGAASAAAAQAQPSGLSMKEAASRHDEAVERYLRNQVTDPSSRWCGSMPDAYGLHEPGSASGAFQVFTAAYLQPLSKYHQSAEVLERIRLAAGHLDRVQTPDGNVDLLITNFNSPPDVSFVTVGLAPAVALARQANRKDIEGMIEPFLGRAGTALVNGGVHTPNHRWVACAALASLYELYREEAYAHRAEEWLMEGIDIDADGQFSERSTAGYNAICDWALLLTAEKLNRPELLEPVRRNLDAMQYLLHADGEVVTEISHRQDQNTRGNMGGYWFPVRYMANKDRNGRYESLARSLEPQYASLTRLMEYPFLLERVVEPEPLPRDFEKLFPANGVVRYRRGDLSATILLRENSRLFAARKGEAVIEGVRMAAAFFGKGQFVPGSGRKQGQTWKMTQTLDAGYYQPFGDGRKQPWGVESWYDLRDQRRRTEVCEMHYDAAVSEAPGGFDIRLRAWGTRDAPVAVEVNLREGGKLTGCREAPGAQDAYLLERGSATYTVGSDSVTFGPGLASNEYTQVRGAAPKLQGPSVYLTGYAPFDHTLRIRFS